jgi:type I site-specific restriction endonuclease
MEVQAEQLRERADQAKAEVSSDVFINRVKRAAKKEKSVEADLENGIRASLEMARTLLGKSTDPGSRANALTKTVGLEEINTALAEVAALAEATKKLANIRRQHLRGWNCSTVQTYAKQPKQPRATARTT